jgi:AcrR family transcriptional regulator
MSASLLLGVDGTEASRNLRARKFAYPHRQCDTGPVTAERTGLRERKKQATRDALRTAALRLALERGPENLRVDDIAAEAGVSPRTYNNYFSSREQAIVAGITAEREARVALSVAARPPEARLSDVVIDAVVEQHTDPAHPGRDGMLLITTSPALRTAYVETATTMEEPLADAIIERSGNIDRTTARVLAASVAAATRVALQEWLRSTGTSSSSGLVIPTGSLPDLLRVALAPLRVALDSATASGASSVGPDR